MRSTELIRKVPRVPRWLYHRFRWGLVYRAQQRLFRYRSYDYERLHEIIAALTGTTAEESRACYAELWSKGILKEIESLVRRVPGLEQDCADLNHLGAEKFFRLDRTVLYCIVRLTKPDVFIETGTRWGISSYFIARAMEENRKGRLYTFDLGVEASRAEYSWPKSQSKIGFVIPSRLEQFVSFIEGDALKTLPEVLELVNFVDVYYFDSNQTYDHMTKEYSLVFPHMRKGGLFMSEDTDKNNAWSDFIKDKQYSAEGRYCSHIGLSTEREVSAIRV